MDEPICTMECAAGAWTVTVDLYRDGSAWATYAYRRDPSTGEDVLVPRDALEDALCDAAEDFAVAAYFFDG